MPGACTASRYEKELREMTGARWSLRKMATAIGVHPTTIKMSLDKLGLEHGGNMWSERKFKTLPILAALREERMRQGLTVTALAAKVGWDRSSLFEWERGARRIHGPALVDLAQALGFEVVLKRIES